MKIYYCLLILLLCSALPIQSYFFLPTYKKPFVIFIEAQGNAHNPGRTIDDSFESEITFNAAQLLKNSLEQMHNSIKIIVQRADGLSNANIANKLNVDLYLSIGACKGTQSGICLYRFDYQDSFILKEGISFIPYNQIYLLNQSITLTWITTISTFLKQKNILKGLYACPYRPLIGIKASALGLELSLKDKADWSECMVTFAHSLTPIITG